uniref:DUF3638 domain-containing protein n=1 Tax=Peronospora matthiolae TaxID=2874970 RepID=A0AAV1V887_9STRA
MRRTENVCASIDLECTEQMRRTENMIAEVMSRRIFEIVAYVKAHGIDHALTDLVRLVSATAPGRLEWKEFRELSLAKGQFGSCFEATDEEANVHYSINLFTGLVLTDGHAPGGLPSDIRQHENFGLCSATAISKSLPRMACFRSERKYNDRLYDFTLEDGELHVQELTSDTSGDIIMTLQLCSSSWVKTLTNLPARLQSLYSHWYWAEMHCVLFRPKEAKCRDVLFVAKVDEDGLMQCYRVPVSDTTRPYGELMENLDVYDRFVCTEKLLLTVFDVLVKFEEARFLHPLKSPDGVVRIELPRFKLSFYLNGISQFESVEHKGYILATNQQFDDFLPRFQRYLVLMLKDSSDTSRPELRLLLPVGVVKEAADGVVDITICGEASRVMDVACYDIHRRLKTFETETIYARLQFAAICARAGTDVPSKRLGMTGSEAAIQILRACRSSRPFSGAENEALLSIYRLSYREPAVKILVLALRTDANRLAFLFGQTHTIAPAMESTDEKTEYANMCSNQVQRNPLRSQLRSKEEGRILGHVQHSSVSFSVEEAITCDSSSVADDYVRSIEKRLGLFLWKDASKVKHIPTFALDCNSTNAMGTGMLDELKSSWDSYHSQSEARLKAEPAVLLDAFETVLQEVSSHRIEMETCVRDCVTKARSSTYDRLLKLANFLPLLTVSDIVRCGFDGATLHTLAPKLSETSRELVTKDVFNYMELCVLEDKLKRLIWMARRSGEVSNTIMIDELMNTRQWQSAEHPYWLAFEVEGRLQIRHEQFVIARHLIDRPGTVCQLNMGRGKT